MTPRQERFAQEYLLDLCATQAAIRAGYSAKTAASQGERLLRQPAVQQAVQAAKKARSERTEITADRVLQELGRVAFTNAAELVSHRIGCCRHCWGKGHRYQFTAIEWERAEDGHMESRTAAIAAGDEDPGPLDPQGGTGFRGTREPNAACTECWGEGVPRVTFVDTSRMSEGARALYAGVKLTKDGMEMKLHSKDGALELVARHLGMLKDKVELDASGGLADLLRAIDGKTRGLPSGGAGVGHDRAQPTVAQSLLEAREERRLVAGLHVDDPAGREAGLSERRREQVGPRHAPQDLALGARRDPGREQGGGRAVHRAMASACDLVQGAECQAAARQALVKHREPERQHCPAPRDAAVEALDTPTEFGDNGGVDGRTH